MFFVTGLILLITVLNIIFFYLRQHQEQEQGFLHRNDASLSSSSLSGSQCRRFSLAEIKFATQNFDEGLVIGRGGFGIVYKGTIDNGETTVAIKRLGIWSKQGAPEFWTEIEMLSKFRHCHLVSLIGFCDEQPEMVLVYEYMPGGTLADNLHKVGSSNRALSWEQRLKVCIGGARGLDYLHTGTDIQTRVIHRDVKSSNILLDGNWEAKISDFGLSKIGPAEQPFTHVSTHVKGTFGYLDPEYLLTRRLTRKSDVYAFGVVLFETLCGRAAVNVRLEEEQWSLAKWAKRCIKEGRLHEIVDPHLRGSILSDCLDAFAQIAEQCLNSISRKRPTMAQVVTRLEYALSLQESSSFSLMDAEISSRDCDNQEGSDPSTEAEPSDSGSMKFSREPKVFHARTGGHNQEHAARRSKSLIQPAKKMKFVKTMRSLFSTNVQTVTDDEHSYFRLGQLKRFSLTEIQVATNNYSTHNCLSSCGFDKVYQGHLADGSPVAIKTHDKRHIYGGKLQFQKEVEAIGKAVHRNLLQLRGFCMSSTERLLVYPYMANGSVASRLREGPKGQPSLDWRTRKRIALDSARGLAYLHHDCIPAIIHRKIKTSNIFLDAEFEVVIGNFGLAQCMYESDALIYPVIIGVTAPKYLTTGKFSQKTDVYAYGVMLLELITGQRPFDLAKRADAENVWIFDWVKRFLTEKKLETLVDVGLHGNYVYEEVEQLTQVALLCTQASSPDRPRMPDIVSMLQGDGSWVESQKGNTFGNTSRSENSWITDSVEDIPSEELLSPR